jgi:CBS domain-containing protein
MNINDYIVDFNASIYEALVKIEKNKHRSLIVVDSLNRVVGTVSDGDIRKGLINRILLDASVSKVMNLNYKKIYEDQEINFDLFLDENNIFIVPIVDGEMKFVDLKVK